MVLHTEYDNVTQKSNKPVRLSTNSARTVNKFRGRTPILRKKTAK